MSTSRRPAVPRPSASLIVVDNSNRVLMVQRNPNSTSFAGAYVFPGGNYDAKQDTSNRMTAIRETFEESGLLLASSSASVPPDESALETARKSIHAQKLTFSSFLANNELIPDEDSLLPFTQWITPPTIPRRFHTHFFITFLPSISSTGFSSGQRLHQQLPTPDGGVEVISARFISPQDAIAEFQAKKISVMPPQFYLLTTLASIFTTHMNTPEQRETVAHLARGTFGKLAINPRQLPEKDGQGLTILTYEGDEARGGHPGARHRAHVLAGKGGVSIATIAGLPSVDVNKMLADSSYFKMEVVSLERNIDIFSDILKSKDSAKL